MNLKRKNQKQLQSLKNRHRPDAITGIYLIFALVTGALLSESLTIVREMLMGSFPDFYRANVWVFVAISVASAFLFCAMAYHISIKPHDEVYDEIQRRSKNK